MNKLEVPSVRTERGAGRGDRGTQATLKPCDRCCDGEHTGEAADLGHGNFLKTVTSELRPEVGKRWTQPDGGRLR